jgi:alkyl hydroperoxide reductase subunit AhpF
MGRTLDIYIDQTCTGCVHAQNLAEVVRQTLPQLEVRIFDLEHPNSKKPSSVFAVPTYMLNGKILALGNPDINDLVAKIEDGLNNP